ncbi:hypothetical protein PS664_03761 [Pseudomonas fluorescens]|nr:hypothetical protein PS664_03761 [Pseudomonas fluorescens]
MKGNLLNRWMYLLIFFVLLVGAICFGFSYPALLENAVNFFGFLGFWITLYGLIVAILEIVRTGSVATQMALAAEVSHNSLRRQVEFHDAQGYIEMINEVLTDLDKKKAVKAASMARIKQCYIAIFLKVERSNNYDDNLKVLNDYEYVAGSRNKAKANPNYDASQHPAANTAAVHPYKLTIDALKQIQDEILEYLASKHEYTGGVK